MKNLSLILAAAFIAVPLQGMAQTGPASASPKWFQCAADTDCVAVKAGCDKTEGVNKKYLKAFKSSIANSVQAPTCPQIAGNQTQAPASKKAKAKCVSGMCSVLLSPSAAP